MDDSVFDLTAKQKECLKTLKKAYQACIKAGMFPVNIYSHLTFYNKAYVNNYGNSDDHFDPELSIDMHGDSKSSNYLSIPHEWTDDSHIILLTEKGMKKYKKDNDLY